ncbi:hypothetical protein MMC07_001323 [Pseudocyphellaria aurata]|nr:hypothetical protein [Pseudocyphellaria aurata]
MAFVDPLFEFWIFYSRLTLLLGGFLAYIVGLVIYRLYLSPIARFPGPKFTAITSWVQFYHDVVRGGQFPWVIQQWHKKYGSALNSFSIICHLKLITRDQGPIIRINPNEIHISDPEFYDIIYSHTRVRKQESFRYRLGNPGSMHSAPEKNLHQQRRAALVSSFSRRQVLEFTPYIQRCVNKLCHRLDNEYRGTLRVVRLDDAFAAFTTDSIIYYAFARSYDFLNYPDFVVPFTTGIEKLFSMSQISQHFPWVFPFLESLPNFVSAIVQPSMVSFFTFRDLLRRATVLILFLQEIKTQILKTIEKNRSVNENAGQQVDESKKHKAVFEEVLHYDLPPEELSVSRLQDEALIVVTAGIGTSKTTMCIACYHVLSNPNVYQLLCRELKNAFPDPAMQPTLPELEKLPYLSAVIQEAFRFSYGASQRLPRISDSAIEYGAYTIPPGVPVSLTCYIQHHDERLFPASQTFDPDRWLENPKAPGTDKPLSNYLVSFSKGTRNCLGMNLANAEIYIGLATIFRRVKMELFETQRDAVDMAADYFVQFPKAGTKGVRVLIK